MDSTDAEALGGYSSDYVDELIREAEAEIYATSDESASEGGDAERCLQHPLCVRASCCKHASTSTRPHMLWNLTAGFSFCSTELSECALVVLGVLCYLVACTPIHAVNW